MAERFEPSLFSLEVNQFIIDHAGEPPEIAFKNGLPGTLRLEPRATPDMTKVAGMAEVGTSRAEVFPIIDKLYRLHQRELHDDFEWAGLDAVKAACQNYLIQHKKWTEAQARGGPAYPSQLAWDKLGRGHQYGPGADAGGLVHTYFDERGNRLPLGIDLVGTGSEQYVPDWVKRPAKPTPVMAQAGSPVPVMDAPTELEEDAEHGNFICPICKHTEGYQIGSQAKRNMARAKMAKHLLRSTKESEMHRHLHSYVFGSATVTPRG